MEEDKAAIVQSSIDLVNEIVAILDYGSTVKKQFCNLARRLKLLTSMFEEIRDSREVFPEETLKALISFKEALESAKQLLRFESEGSKIYMEMRGRLVKFPPSPSTVSAFLRSSKGLRSPSYVGIIDSMERLMIGTKH